MAGGGSWRRVGWWSAALAGACGHPSTAAEPGPSIVDGDADGVPLPADCDDARTDVGPSAAEVCNGRDDDCDGRVDDADIDLDPASATPWYADADGDGYGDPYVAGTACAPPAGTLEVAGDCDDGHPDIHPLAPELCGGVDEDCDALIDEADADLDASWLWTGFVDMDGDGVGAGTEPLAPQCPPSGAVSLGGDCDDAAAHRHPGAPEVCGDGIDDNCTGVDEPCSGPLVGSLSSDADSLAIWLGAEEDSWFGYAVVGADVDGDGDVELLVGEPSATDPTSDEGRLIQIEDPAVPSAWLEDGTPTVHGESADDMLGGTLAVVGDADGDGLLEWAVAARLNDQAAPDAGCVYLLSGPISDGASMGSQIELRGPTGGDQAGDTIADGVDFDGDGLDSVVIGSRLANIAGTQQGAVWWVDSPLADLGLGDLDTVIVGSVPEGQFGAGLASGDLSGDGVPDLLVGSDRAPGGGVERGRVDWFLGPTPPPDSASADYALFGVANDDKLGDALALGDPLGTGNPAAVMGAVGSDLVEMNAGGVWVVPSPPSVDGDLEAASESRIDGASNESIGGVFALGDLDRDGFDDIVLGSPEYDSGVGRAFAFYGPWFGANSVPDADAYVAASGLSDGLGSAVSFLGDVNADGYPEVALGAWASDRAGVDAGLLFVLPGAPR